MTEHGQSLLDDLLRAYLQGTLQPFQGPRPGADLDRVTTWLSDREALYYLISLKIKVGSPTALCNEPSNSVPDPPSEILSGLMVEMLQEIPQVLVALATHRKAIWIHLDGVVDGASG